MNRYPLWKYLIILVAIILGIIYTVPNFFGETPAVQISTNRQSISINDQTEKKVVDALNAANIANDGIFIADKSLKVRFKDTETQLKAREIIESSLGDGYITALNLLPDSPEWMAKIGANPMNLGLDLRGGVHFTLQVDSDIALQKTFDRYSVDIRRELKNLKIRVPSPKVNKDYLTVNFQSAEDLQVALPRLKKIIPDADFDIQNEKELVLTLPADLIQQIQNNAVKQNIATLHNRVNELGVAEPVIQQAGVDRIVLQLPGVQDTAKAKDIIGRTAILEVRKVNDNQDDIISAINGNVPTESELLYTADENPKPILVFKQVELTGDSINSAHITEDDRKAPAVGLSLDSAGANIFAELTAQNIGKRIAMVLIDQGKAEVVTAPSVNQTITGGQVLISGNMNINEVKDTVLLLGSGSLAAPMKIIEERTIGPSLGQENIEKGFKSTLWGFAVVALFMIIYYRLIGLFSVISLTTNLLFLLSILSALIEKLTLPGSAALALTLGMAIDANVLICERIREELRHCANPQVAINLGYQHAKATIVDSNITSLIAGLALLIFGSGPVRGFAVVHCIGIATSMFSAVVVSRAMVNLWYGKRKHLKTLSIGSIWKPSDSVAGKE